MLTISETFDESLLELPAERLYEKLAGPTLFHLKGEKEPALYLSTLLHGNENSGWEVVKNILIKYKGKKLPRSLSIFIGNIEAARYKKRRLEHQPDYNRVWAGGDSKEHEMMMRVLEAVQQRGVFASIDIHNNNGLNPHYACVNKLDKRYLTLAREFSKMVIYFVRPSGVQSLAFAKLCPAVTLECGQPGDEIGIQMTTRFVDNIIQLEKLEPAPNIEKNVDLYHTVGVIKIPDKYEFSFDSTEKDIEFIKGIESLNFEEIPEDTLLANLNRNIEKPFIALDEDGNDIFDRYFVIKENGIYTNTKLMPAMFTTDKNIIQQDCLCYLMEQYDIQQGEKKLIDSNPVWQ